MSTNESSLYGAWVGKSHVYDVVGMCEHYSVARDIICDMLHVTQGELDSRLAHLQSTLTGHSSEWTLVYKIMFTLGFVRVMYKQSGGMECEYKTANKHSKLQRQYIRDAKTCAFESFR